MVLINPSWTERSVYSFPSIPCCKVPLALKRSVAAYRFLNKICFNEGYLSGPKVCRSNLETPCTTLPLLHLHHSSSYNTYVASPTSQLILQHFRCFTYITAHSTTLPLLHLRPSSFSNPSVSSPTSQLTLQPFRCFTYVTGTSPTSPDEPPMFACYVQRLVLK